tara:strand:+ start:717 stop:1364 length:648 start_codon:yes stop_codon:yes gene_type:complete
MSKELLKRIISSIFLIPITLFLIIEGSILFNFFILICFVITIYEWNKMVKKKSYYVAGIVFFILSFFSIYSLRNNFEGDYFYFLFVVIICISTDLGGYIFGKIFKGPKLIKISPKKTYSGMIGGYLLSIIFIKVFLEYEQNEVQLVFKFKLLIFILLISSISQLGDIIISYFKRLSKIKDTGRIIPGHGGLLDRIDGMIFAFPFSYILFLTDKIG